MKTQINEVQAIYNSAAKRQQYVGKPIFIIVEKEDHAAIHEKERLDIDKIAAAAGVEMRKTARVAMRRGMRQQQETGLKEINTLLQEIRSARSYKEVITQTGIATGYANAMYCFNLMSENELKDVIGVIGQAGEQTARRIKAASRPFWARIVRKGAKV